jgi:type 1 glutamine amidotransferase
MLPRIPRHLPVCAALAMSVLTLNAAPLRVLFFTKSSGWEHDVIRQVNGQPSYAEKVLARIAAREDYVVTTSKDGSLFSPDYLKQFDVLVFYTSGDLTSTGNDRHPGITGPGLQALFDYVAHGGGLVGVHSASDCFHTQERGGGNNPRRLQRYRNYGDMADPFARMLGGEFIRHGAQQVAAATIVDDRFPGFGGHGAEVKVMEEWYTLKDFAADDHVLLVMQTAGMEGGDYQRPPYPLAWVRPHGQGRVAYNAMGHREDVWDSSYFQAMLAGMINWAGKRVDADLTPNLAQVAPGHATLQKPPPEVKE